MLAILAAAALGAQTSAPPAGRPQPTRLPTAAQVHALYPPAAKAAGIEGEARVRCRATAEGALAECVVLSETPTGHGFGAALVQAASLYRLAPTKSDGTPIEGQAITMPMRFSLKPRPDSPEGQLEAAMRATMLGAPIPGHDVVLVKAPTPEVLGPYWPAEARAKKIDGAVQLDCTVAASGRLENCSVLHERPAGMGFGAGAVALFSNEVVLAAKTKSGAPSAGRKVQPTIRFNVK